MSCLVIQAVGLVVWMQAKQPHNFVLNAFDVSVSWTMKSVLGPWRTRKGSTERKFPLFVLDPLFSSVIFCWAYQEITCVLKASKSFCKQELVIDGHCSSSEAATSNALNEAWNHASFSPTQPAWIFSRIQKPVQNHRWNFGVKKLQIYNSSILSWISSCIWIFQPQVVSENPKRHCRLRPPLTLDPSSLETEIRLATRKHELKSELMEMFARFGMDYWWMLMNSWFMFPFFRAALPKRPRAGEKTCHAWSQQKESHVFFCGTRGSSTVLQCQWLRTWDFTKLTSSFQFNQFEHHFHTENAIHIGWVF